MQSDQEIKRLRDWQERQELAEAMVPLVGKMYRDHGVVTLIYGRPLIILPPIEIMKLHRFVRQVEEILHECVRKSGRSMLRSKRSRCSPSRKNLPFQTATTS